MSHRKMADPAYRAGLHARLRESHIAPITAFIEQLSGSDHGFIPYVSPDYGGTKAEILLIFQDPGPKTHGTNGSGMLCAENDDPSAELLSSCFDEIGLDVARVITWNAYPWYINATPTSTQLEAGIEPLRQLLDLLPDVSVVMLMGRKSENGWSRFQKRYPTASRGYTVIASRHPSGRGITNGGQNSRAEGIERLTADLARAKSLIG